MARDGYEKSNAIAICRSSMNLSNIRFIEPFAYKPGQPFRVMPVGEFKRGSRTLKITPADLQQMAANYDSGKPRWTIPLYFGHPTDVNPDPPKVGNVKRLLVKPDGLYAEPEYTSDGEKAVADGAYQFVSPGVLWSKNGSSYTDDQGKEFDNVIDHVALTNKPYFGKNTQLFSSVPELMQLDMGRHKHMLSTIMGLVQRLKDAILAEESAEDVEDTAEGETDTSLSDTTPKTATGQPAPTATLQAGLTTETYADLPPMIKCPECGHTMPKGTTCPECGYKDTGKEKMNTETMAVWTTAMMNDLPDSAFLYIAPGGEKDDGGKTQPRALRYFPYRGTDGKIDLPHLRNALARIPQSKLPADVKAAVIKKATKIAQDEGVGEGAKKEEMSAHGNSAGTRKEKIMAEKEVETFAVSAEEFAALKVKAEKAEQAEKMAAEQQKQLEKFAAELMAEKDARRLDQLTDAVETFRALPVDIKIAAPNLLKLEKLDAGLAAWVIEQFTAFDKALGQSKIFEQLATGRPGATQAETIDQVADKILKEKFGGDGKHYQEAFSAASKERPDLFADYMNQARGLK